jgi:erythronate-4-phosphate dehydrogenase
MKIIADQNIPLVKESFAHLGEVVLMSGRDMTNGELKDADVLMVRSITKVNERLLENTGIRFVGTATIGTDHVDEQYLKNAGIKFASAPGSNADSVAEYVVSALLNLEKKLKTSFTGKNIGIIGCGNVGSRVKKRAEAIGLNCLINDPPLERAGKKGFLPIEDVLALSDIVTVHVPLSNNGDYPTYKLINERFISNMKHDAVLFNTSRGAVLDEEAVKANRNKLGGLVLDVWNNEPAINNESLDITDIATPHIAGYSYDGKVKGTMMLYDALCGFLSLEKTFDFVKFSKPDKPLMIDLGSSSDILFDAVNAAYPIMKDDADLRAIKGSGNQSAYFDKLRKDYFKRREFFNFTLSVTGDADKDKLKALKNLGFVLNIGE